MDNVTHTLVGAALGRTGLHRRTGFSMATLMVGANVPDIDVLGLLAGENLAWRRGWTHGPIALLILPAVAAWAFAAFDRWQTHRGTRPPDRPPVRMKWLLALSYLGTLSHPLLDLLNTYGIRCLMPFSERWFYGDTLFIVDPLVWTALGLGLWLSYRLPQPLSDRPALAALLAAAGYCSAMFAAGRAAENYVAGYVRASGQQAPERVLANPVFFDPLRRRMVIETAGTYRFADFQWLPGPRLVLAPEPIPANRSDPAVTRAKARDKRVADFLYWSRYPFATIQETPGGKQVTIGDARYNARPDQGTFSVSTLVPFN